MRKENNSESRNTKKGSKLCKTRLEILVQFSPGLLWVIFLKSLLFFLVCLPLIQTQSRRRATNNGCARGKHLAPVLSILFSTGRATHFLENYVIDKVRKGGVVS